ncbi:hypothetical protein QMK38_00990 [Lysinibacillus fusiformis]|nr:hypothetical protein [Lysinibacillus fusiformis]
MVNLEVSIMTSFDEFFNNPINKIALIIGVCFIGVLTVALILGKLLKLMGLSNRFIRPMISVVATLGFLYLVVLYGDWVL